MRPLFPVFLSALFSLPAQAAGPAYEFYVLACDVVSDCRQVASILLSADGRVEEPATPGIGIRIGAPVPTAVREPAGVRLTVSLEPARLFVAGNAPSGGPVNLQFDSNSLRPGYFSPIAVFASDGIIYQLWGKLLAPRAGARQIALQ